MSTIERFEDIEAWKLARKLTSLIYEISAARDFSRDFALRDQIRRASISIVSNIAEGFERDGDREFLQFLSVAKGFCGEVRAQLYLAFDRAYMSEKQFAELTAKALELSRVISGLIRYLRSSQFSGKKFKTAHA
jgi:four helix bundle protein